jgi:aspartate kinase
MSLIVQKFGGTSVGTLDRIKNVADKVKAAYEQGHQIVVVLSAMSGRTDELVQKAQAMVEGKPNNREYDVLLSIGEQETIALLAMRLIQLGCPACSYLGHQIPIITSDAHNKARILSIEPSNIQKDLDAGKIVVIAGFQGKTAQGDITTLGRGGSDTTAVALAAALKADECQIYTDVEGVYTTDPRIEPRARLLTHITFEEMLELASLGAKVLQIRSVEFAGRYKVPLRVLSSFVDGPGTLITVEEDKMEHVSIAGIAYNKDEAKLTVRRVVDRPGVAYQILGPISDANIEVDMILQNTAVDGMMDFTFTVHKNDYDAALEILQRVGKDLGAEDITGDKNIVKISLVGVGMRSHAGIASKMFNILGKESINIQLITTSEIKISVVVESKYLELGVRTLHEAFKLDQPPLQE